MSETFSLRGEDPTGRRGPRRGAFLVLAVVAAGLLWMAWRAVERRHALAGGLGPALLQDAEARKQALQRILPGACLPEPFVLRGASRLGATEAVWMRRDRDDTHAILFGSRGALDATALREVIAELAGQELPRRQLVDETGVEIEKRPPFVEEYRRVAPAWQRILPPAGWAQEWLDAGRASAEPAAGGSIPLDLGDGASYRLWPFRRDGAGVWWAVVDLAGRVPEGSALFLLYARGGPAAPGGGELVDFLGRLLRLR